MSLGPDKAPLLALPPSAGAYLLLLALPRRLHLRGAVAGRPLAPGLYGYCGSARGPGGLRARIARHLRPGRRPRWHVDQLLDAAASVLALPFPAARECQLAADLARAGASMPIAGFGSSDCTSCRAHLVHLSPQAWVRALARDWSLQRSGAGVLLGPDGVLLIVEKDALGRAVEILELARAQRPQEREQAEETHEQGDRNEIDEHLHGARVPTRPSLTSGTRPGAATLGSPRHIR